MDCQCAAKCKFSRKTQLQMQNDIFCHSSQLLKHISSIYEIIVLQENASFLAICFEIALLCCFVLFKLNVCSH